MTDDLWTYRAKLDGVVDGDTIDLTLDLGFRVHKKVRVRLHGVDTAEIYGVPKDSPEYERGIEQRDFVGGFCAQDGEWPLRFESYEEAGKYGRWIGDIKVNGTSLVESLIEEWPEVEDA